MDKFGEQSLPRRGSLAKRGLGLGFLQWEPLSSAARHALALALLRPGQQQELSMPAVPKSFPEALVYCY